VHALALAAVAAWCFVTALVGGLVGLVLGNIRLPVVLLAASSPASSPSSRRRRSPAQSSAASSQGHCPATSS
jgi:hypothetical protein